METIREGIRINGPIYIGGVSYSGKTQLRLLLSQHPKIIITRRTYLWRKFNQKFGSLDDKGNFENCLNALLKLESIQNLNPDPSRIQDEFWQGEHSYRHLFSIIHQHYAESLGKDRWGIQIGMVEKEAELIFNADTSAKIIQIVRNPLDRIAESINSSTRRKLSLGLETNLWVESIQYARENLKKFPSKYMVIKWEDLLADVDHTIGQICGFLGEKYSPEMIQADQFINIGLDLADQSMDGPRNLVLRKSVSRKPLKNAERLYIISQLKSQMVYFGYTDQIIPMNFNEKMNYLSLHFPAFLLGGALKGRIRTLKKIKQTLSL